MSEPAGVARDEGLALLQNGDLEAAQARLAAAVSRQPEDARAHSLLGICEARRGNYAPAIASLETTLQLTPEDPAAYFNLANVLTQCEQGERARVLLRDALLLRPNYPAAQELLDQIEGTDLRGESKVNDAAAGAGSSVPLISSNGNSESGSSDKALRIGRGLGWGVIYAQAWTLWPLIAMVFWNRFPSLFGLVVVMLVAGIFHALVGALAGLLLAVGKVPFQSAPMVGVILAVAVCGLEIFLTGSPNVVVNGLFFVITGGYLGTGVASRIYA